MPDALEFKHRYTSGVIAWAPDNAPTDAQIGAVLDEFERTDWAGLEPDRYAWAAVLHRDVAEAAHVHVLAALCDLESRLAPASVSRHLGSDQRRRGMPGSNPYVNALTSVFTVVAVKSVEAYRLRVAAYSVHGRRIRAVLIQFWSVGLPLWTVSACGGSEGPAASEQGDEAVERVVVTPGSVELIVGDTLTFVATVTGMNGTTLTDRPLLWTSSDSTIVSVTSSGAAAARRPGRATITATADGRSGNATVAVSELPVARVVMSVDSANLTVRTRLQLTAVLLSSTGDTLADRSIAWTSSDTAVAVVSSSGAVAAVGAGTASIMAGSESQLGSTAITVSPSELTVRGLYVQFEKRGWPSGYWSGDLIKSFADFDGVVGHTVAEEVSQQLDAMATIGVNTITFELRSADSVFIPGPREFPECNVSPSLGLLWPNPAGEHLANLVSFFDLVQSKGMRVFLRLVNTRMDERYRAEAEMWLGAILASIQGHPALELVLFEGDERYGDSDGDGVADSCGHQAEPPLWFGPDGVGGRYVEWAIEYGLSMGFVPQRLSAEAVIGVFVIDQGPDLWFTPAVMKTIFDRVGIPDDQRTYAISFYQARRCRFSDGLPCEDAHPHAWTDESLLRTMRAIGHASSARVIVPEFGVSTPVIDGGWGSAEALESAVELMRKRGVAGGSFWRWTSFEDEEDADPTEAEPVKRRGPEYVYTRVREVMRRLYGS